jgi:hypothetical protein
MIVFGLTITDAFLMAKTVLPPGHRVHEMTIIEFAALVTRDLYHKPFNEVMGTPKVIPGLEIDMNELPTVGAP